MVARILRINSVNENTSTAVGALIRAALLKNVHTMQPAVQTCAALQRETYNMRSVNVKTTKQQQRQQQQGRQEH